MRGRLPGHTTAREEVLPPTQMHRLPSWLVLHQGEDCRHLTVKDRDDTITGLHTDRHTANGQPQKEIDLKGSFTVTLVSKILIYLK